MIKVKAKRNGIFEGHYFFSGQEAVLPESAVEAYGNEFEDYFEVLETVEEPKKGKKEIEEAPKDKQIKSPAVVK